ncbi:hypothetical protein HPB51_006277 [Rhipicephalus microplus]|uniref:M13 family peptidase n=1 Tax=Rhipicephalus microplus TaxID=6941 RepID=A0A9J6EM49_RHIMP|nr:hypothetical protein HPB51_006277 [Rhipicephalus microplus]
MNTSVDPCTDFYAYACGGWMAKHKIPESQSMTSSFSLLDDELRETLRGILGNMSIVREHQNVTDKAAIVYNACLAVPDLEDRPDVMLAIMNASGLAQWPITGPRREKNSIGTTTEDVLKQTGIATLFALGVSRDLRKLSSYAIQLDQPDFSAVGRNEIINQTTDYSKPIIDAYKNVIIVAMKIIKPNLLEDELHKLANRLLAFEGKLANLTAPPEERRDALRIYRRTTIDELKRNFTNIPIGDLLQKKFRLADITLALNETVELFALEYYRKLNTFLSTIHANTLFNYAGLRRMLQWAEAVSKDFRKASFELRAVKEGLHVQRPRWQVCVDEVNDDMPEIVGKLYVQSKFSPEAKHELAQMATKIGYPDWLFNDTYMEELYKFVPQLSVNTSYGEMMYALSDNHWKQEMLKLRKPYSKDTEWPVSLAVVNAFYNPNGNEMGSQFDTNGALKEWWTNDTRTKFTEKAKCFEEEYGNITDVETNMTLNGKNTLGENIADNGGLHLAFEAYKRLLQVEYKNVDTRLKDLEEFSGEQLFFIANAMIMCSLSRPESLKEQIQYDPHSPSQYGINVPLSNLPAFSDTFNCSANSAMNRQHRCAICPMGGPYPVVGCAMSRRVLGQPISKRQRGPFGEASLLLGHLIDSASR